MKPQKLTTKLFSLSCENQPGILSRVITMLTRPGYEIETVSQSRTDVSEFILITVEVAIPGAAVDNMARRLRRIIGVMDLTVSFGSVLNSAIYRVALQACKVPVWEILHRHNANSVSLQDDGHLLIHQVARSAEIRKLYHELDGPALIGFSQLPLAISQPLCWGDIKDCTNYEIPLNINSTMSNQL